MSLEESGPSRCLCYVLKRNFYKEVKPLPTVLITLICLLRIILWKHGVKSWLCCSNGTASRYLKGTWNQKSFLVQALPEGTIKVCFSPTHLSMRTLGCLALAKHPCSAEGTEGDAYAALFGLSSLVPCWNWQDRVRAPAISGLMLWQHVCTWFELTSVNLQGTANMLRNLSGKSSGVCPYQTIILMFFWTSCSILASLKGPGLLL